MVFELVLIIFGTVIGSFLNDLLDEYKPGMVAVIKHLCYVLYFKYTDLIFNIKLWLDNKSEDKNNEEKEEEKEPEEEPEDKNNELEKDESEPEEEPEDNNEEVSDDTVIIKDE